MLNLAIMPFVCDGTQFPIESSACIAPLGTHLMQCLICVNAKPPSHFAEFCYQDYRVTGDSSHKRDARHPFTICKSCFQGYVRTEIPLGKLYIKCPCCPRALQTRELREVVDSALYRTLVERIAEAEQAHIDDNSVAMMLDHKLDLRRCPDCNTIIEVR